MSVHAYVYTNKQVYMYMHMCAYADEVLGHMRGSEPPNPNQSKALNPTA